MCYFVAFLLDRGRGICIITIKCLFWSLSLGLQNNNNKMASSYFYKIVQNDTMYNDVDGINLLSCLLCYSKKFHILSVFFNANFFNYKTRYILFPAYCP